MRTLLLISVFAALGLAGGAAAQNPMLFATVGPGFSIKLAPDPSGGRVLQIPPGTYTINVRDLSPEHNFHLSGPGVDMATSVEETATAIWTITFQEGTYHFECDAHPTTMKGDFTVVAGAPLPTAPPPPAPSPAPPARPKPLSLVGAVGPGATISLRSAGKKVVSVKAGPVVVTVRDLSVKDNFHLTGPGVNRTTSKLGKATLVWKLTLKRGLYTYRSDASPKVRGSFRAV
jgi:hypothetical protein